MTDAPTPKSPDRAHGDAGAEPAVLCEICQQAISDSDPGADDEHGMLAHEACYARAIDAANDEAFALFGLEPAPPAGPADAVAGGLVPRPFAEAPRNGSEVWAYRPDAGWFAVVRVHPMHEDGDGPDEDQDMIWCSVTGEDLSHDLPTLYLPNPIVTEATLADPGAGRVGDAFEQSSRPVFEQESDRGEGAALPGVEEIAELRALSDAAEAAYGALQAIRDDIFSGKPVSGRNQTRGQEAIEKIDRVLRPDAWDRSKDLRARLAARGTAAEGDGQAMPVVGADLRDEALFLLDRLTDLGSDAFTEDGYRDFCGHVAPSMSRLAALASAAGGGAGDGWRGIAADPPIVEMKSGTPVDLWTIAQKRGMLGVSRLRFTDCVWRDDALHKAGWWLPAGWSIRAEDVTHWRSLPAPPTTPGVVS